MLGDWDGFYCCRTGSRTHKPRDVLLVLLPVVELDPNALRPLNHEVCKSFGLRACGSTLVVWAASGLSFK